MRDLTKVSLLCTTTVRTTCTVNHRELTWSLHHHRETFTFTKSAGSPLLSKLPPHSGSPDHCVQTTCIGAADLSRQTLQQPRCGRLNGRHIPTHHFEVFGAALHPAVVAWEQHVLDVVARPVVEFAHVEGAGLVAVEVGPLLQGLQHVLLDQVGVPDLVPGDLSGEDVRRHFDSSLEQLCLALKSTTVVFDRKWYPALIDSLTDRLTNQSGRQNTIQSELCNQLQAPEGVTVWYILLKCT